MNMSPCFGRVGIRRRSHRSFRTFSASTAATWRSSSRSSAARKAANARPLRSPIRPSGRRGRRRSAIRSTAHNVDGRSCLANAGRRRRRMRRPWLRSAARRRTSSSGSGTPAQSQMARQSTVPPSPSSVFRIRAGMAPSRRTAHRHRTWRGVRSGGGRLLRVRRVSVRRRVRRRSLCRWPHGRAAGGRRSGLGLFPRWRSA